MKRLREKLQSQSGTSILLALLMFLVCALVASSVLAAAASNAGRIRSGQVEHQKYLTLSSAIRLICDEVERAEYIGKYQVYEWSTPAVKDKEGNVIIPAVDCFYVEQTAGDYSCDRLTAQLPLGKELDRMFSGQFKGAGYQPLSGGKVEEGPAGGHILTVTLPESLGEYFDSGPEQYRAPREVTVRVELNQNSGHIALTAWLGTGEEPDASEIMEAELVAVNIPALTYSPAGRMPANQPETGAAAETKTSAMNWELHWIKKGGA